MDLTKEQVIELFEEFLDENYYVGELTEANVLWVYENKFYPMIDNVLYEEDEQIPQRKITSRTGPLDPRITKALKTARKKTPEVKDMELTSKGNPENFNTRQKLSPYKDVFGRVKSLFKKPHPEAQRFIKGKNNKYKSAGQGTPFHDDGKSADVAITSKNPRKSDYAAAKFASTAQSQLIKYAKNKDDGPVIGFAVKPGEKSTPKSLSSRGYMNQPKGTPPGVQSIHIGYDNPGKRGTLHRDIRDKYAKRSNVYGPNRMVDPHSGKFALYQQQRTDAEGWSPRRPRRINENEYLPSLFELYVENNYYVERLSEANVLWIYEEEFPQWLEEKMNVMDILGGAAAGAATSAVIGLNPLVGGVLGGISGAMADYPDAKKAGVKKAKAACPSNKDKTTSEKQEEQQISLKMQAYLNEMSKKGTKKPIEYGSDGAITKRDVIIARLQAKKKKSGLSMKEEDLLAKLIAAEEKEDSGKKK